MHNKPAGKTASASLAVQRYLETFHNPQFKRRVDGLSQALLANDPAGGQIHGEPWDVPVLASGHP